ncbi:MAG: MBL fold metallo-hydrolase [Candidatus Omnitrophota bacterium]
MIKISNLTIKQMLIGPMENFIYFVGDKSSKQVAVIDPSWDVDEICAQAKNENLEIAAIILTHDHMDHTNGVSELLKQHDVPVYVNENEKSLKGFSKNIKFVKDQQKIDIGGVECTFLHTPGHTPGGHCILVDGFLFTGDTLFINACGRCDLFGGDAKAMYNTLYRKIMLLSDATIIYPGHHYGSKTSDTLANQKKTNPYLTCKSEHEFLTKRMGL